MIRAVLAFTAVSLVCIVFAIGVIQSVELDGSVSVSAEPPSVEFMEAVEYCSAKHEDPRGCVEAMLNQPLTSIYTEDVSCAKSGDSAPTAIHDEIGGAARSIMMVNDSASVVAAGGSAIDHTTTLTVCNSGCVMDTTYNPDTRKLWCESATDAAVSIEVHWGG